MFAMLVMWKYTYIHMIGVDKICQLIATNFLQNNTTMVIWEKHKIWKWDINNNVCPAMLHQSC